MSGSRQGRTQRKAGPDSAPAAGARADAKPRAPRPPDAGQIDRRRRIAAAAVGGVVVLGVGVAVFAGGGQAKAVAVAERYAKAYARQDPAALYPMLSDEARGRVSRARFVALHREALMTATATRITVAGPVSLVDDTHAEIPLVVRTRVFGTIRRKLTLTFTGDGDHPAVDWRRKDTFPGVAQGAELTRTVRLPPRATLLTRDGQTLARGGARTPDGAIADVAVETVGQLGPVPAARAAELMAAGVPPGSLVGVSGLERALDDRLRGRPGGILSAGRVVLGQQAPRQGPAVRTTIAPSVERAAVAALAGRLGGVVAITPRTGELLAFAGIAFSGLQPPGSTFKMITLAGSLENGITSERASFPVQNAATLEGVELQNANGESCGGSLANSFAESCNSVFAPLGAKLGAQRLVRTAEQFGFNRPPDIAGAATSTLPAAADIGDDLAVGSTAIGQGQVLATALQMATVAATIGLGGRKPRLTVAADERVDNTKLKPVVDPSAARTTGRLMLDVVAYGTGRAAALPGVKVAGKTGTAELESTKACEPTPEDPESCQDVSVTTDTDAWFAAIAPGDKTVPKVAVGVLLVRAGAGGDVAAPAARQVIQAAL